MNRSHGPMRGNRGAGDKPKSFKKPIGKLIVFCKPYLPFIIIAILFAIAGTIFTLIGPNKLSEINWFDNWRFNDGNCLQPVSKIAILLVVLYGLGVLFSYIQGFIMTTITQKVANRLRTGISQKINKLPLKYFDSTSYGDVLSRVTNDVDMIAQTLNQSIGMLVTAITLFLGSLIMMLITNVIMTLAGYFSDCNRFCYYDDNYVKITKALFKATKRIR